MCQKRSEALIILLIRPLCYFVELHSANITQLAGSIWNGGGNAFIRDCLSVARLEICKKFIAMLISILCCLKLNKSL